ncbi:UNVERIFIED_CONTAM: Rust resistance kinase Lr10 [Sesamum calycinum]|uniref:Rust resistance kinase Lr10 n=1 Tax=Sesamum calycinum TaxID=2727403 RepID=A0AAW2RQ91_9LAMI
MIFLLIFLIFSLPVQESRFAAAQNECQPTSCHASGPVVRFPFRLKGRQPEHCGYPGFDLSCNPNNGTEFEFQFPVRASTRNIVLPISARATVQEIDYRSQVIRVSLYSGSCLPNRVPDVNSPASPFQMYYSYSPGTDGFTLFNCSGKTEDTYSGRVSCLDHGGFRVYAYRSYYSVTELSVSSCVKMYNISDISEVILYGPREYSVDSTQLHWTEPSCGSCEARGMYCRLKNNSPNNGTECFDIPRVPEGPEPKKKGLSKNVVIAVVVVSVFMTALVFAALCRVYTMRKRKRQNQRRIEQFLEDYKALRPTRYTYSEIKRITDAFKQKLGRGGYGTVYKGKLSSDIAVAVKVLNNIKGDGQEFINEVGTIGKIHHVNVVRLVGYCADGYRRALVYEFLENDSLEKYISSGKQSSTLGWEKVHKIALGIAKGIDYLHQGCNQRILHFDIKPHNILLDHNLNPKVADFGLAKLCSKEQSVVTMTAARGTIGYIAPEVFSRNFGKVSYKSDIYSYGMLLLDLVGGRRNFHGGGQDSSSELYFPEWMYNQLDKGEDIAIQIEKEADSDIVKRLIIVGLWCIQWYPADRPSTKVVIQMLEGENMPIMPPNPFAPSKSVNTMSTSSGSSFVSAQTSMSNDGTR